MAPAPARSAGRGGGWLGALLVLVVLGIVAAIAVVAVQRSEEGEGSGDRGSVALTKETPPPTTTIPRATQVELLSRYCDAPGNKWPETPRHVPGEPHRTQVRVMGGGVNTAADTKTAPSPIGADNGLGGSTVISPQTDGTFTADLSVLERTRSVTCVTFIATEPTGETCDYNASPFAGPATSYVSLQVARNRYAITVYELHSGGILHKGEIHTRASGCPAYSLTNEGSGYVAFGVTNQDILAWLNQHFVGGKPA